MELISCSQVTKNMGSVVKGLDKALESMDLQKVKLFHSALIILNLVC